MIQAALFAIVSAAEVLSSSIEGAEGGESPDDEGAAQDVADTLLQLLLRLSSLSTSLGGSSARVQLVELQLMQTVAPALMHHLATQGSQAQVRTAVTAAAAVAVMLVQRQTALHAYATLWLACYIYIWHSVSCTAGK